MSFLNGGKHLYTVELKLASEFRDVSIPFLASHCGWSMVSIHFNPTYWDSIHCQAAQSTIEAHSIQAYAYQVCWSDIYWNDLKWQCLRLEVPLKACPALQDWQLAGHRHTRTWHLNLHPAFCALFSKLLQNHQPRQDGRTWQDTQLTTTQHILRPSGAWILTTLLMLLFMISDIWFCWRYFSVLLLIIIIYYNISWMMDDWCNHHDMQPSS